MVGKVEPIALSVCRQQIKRELAVVHQLCRLVLSSATFFANQKISYDWIQLNIESNTWLLLQIGGCLPFPSLNKDLPSGQAISILAYFHRRHQPDLEI